jgi:hypothetical protein
MSSRVVPLFFIAEVKTFFEYKKISFQWFWFSFSVVERGLILALNKTSLT